MSDRGGSADAENAPGSASSAKSASNMAKINDIKGGESTRNLASAGASASAAPQASNDAPLTNALVYENTYKMKPDKKFLSEPVRRIAQEILENHLKKAKYDENKVAELSAKIGNEILAAVKKLEFDRYKVVVDVTIGEFKGQGIRVASRCLWDTTTDTYTSASFKNASLFAVAIVFGCFYE